MKSATKVIIALLVIIGIIAIPVIGGYNTLVNLDQTVNSAEANIETTSTSYGLNSKSC